MTDSSKKISVLPELLSLEGEDWLVLVDKSEGKTKKMEVRLLPIRKKLTENTTFYVDVENGSDNNSGLLETEPRKSLFQLFEYIQKEIDANGFKIDVELFEGEYINESNAEFSSGHFHFPLVLSHDNFTCVFPDGPADPPVEYTPNSPLNIIGRGTAAGTIVHGFELDHEMYVTVSNLTLKASAILQKNSEPMLSDCLRVSRQGCVVLLNVRLEGVDGANSLNARQGGIITIGNTLSVLGNINTLFGAFLGGIINTFEGSRIAIHSDAVIQYSADLGPGTILDLTSAEFFLRDDLADSETTLTPSDNKLDKVYIDNGSMFISSGNRSLIKTVETGSNVQVV